MALFKNAATEWEKTMTENDLDQMEAQGLDVSKYREKQCPGRGVERREAQGRLFPWYWHIRTGQGTHERCGMAEESDGKAAQHV